MKNPLRGIVTVGTRKPVRILFLCNARPMLQVERYTCQSPSCDFQCLVYGAYISVVIGRFDI